MDFIFVLVLFSVDDDSLTHLMFKYTFQIESPSIQVEKLD